MESTPSGFYARAAGAGGLRDGPEDRVAAQFFPPVPGATVLHVHYRDGRFLVRGRKLTPSQWPGA